ncbi:hypothetical protein AB1Y20_000798 [Prymnesium parvum]
MDLEGGIGASETKACGASAVEAALGLVGFGDVGECYRDGGGGCDGLQSSGPAVPLRACGVAGADALLDLLDFGERRAACDITQTLALGASGANGIPTDAAVERVARFTALASRG